MTLSDLIALLEGAGEGSWELDAAIHENLGHCPHLETRYGASDGDCMVDICISCGEDVDDSEVPPVKNYSRSVDAALSLIPREWNAKIEKFKDSDLVQVHMSKTDPYDLTGSGGSYASSWAPGEFKAHPIAIAICIAALKARSPETGE